MLINPVSYRAIFLIYVTCNVSSNATQPRQLLIHLPAVFLKNRKEQEIVYKRYRKRRFWVRVKERKSSRRNTEKWGYIGKGSIKLDAETAAAQRKLSTGTISILHFRSDCCRLVAHTCPSHSAGRIT